MVPGAGHQGHGNHSQRDQDFQSMYPLFGRDPFAFLLACFVLNIIGQITLLALIVTFLFSKRIRKRNATLTNLLIVAVLASIPRDLLFYSMPNLGNPNPPHPLCLTQGVLTIGSDPMYSLASLALVINFVQSVNASVPKYLDKDHLKSPLLVAMPYTVFLLLGAVAGVLVRVIHPDPDVIHHKNRNFCAINISWLNRTVNIFPVVIMVITLLLEDKRTWSSGYGVTWTDLGTDDYTIDCVSLNSFASLALLSFNSADVFSLYWKQSAGAHILPIMFGAMTPLFTFCIFGTTTDCFEAWGCTKRRDIDKPLPARDMPVTDPEQNLSPSLENAGLNTDKPLPSLPPPFPPPTSPLPPPPALFLQRPVSFGPLPSPKRISLLPPPSPKRPPSAYSAASPHRMINAVPAIPPMLPVPPLEAFILRLSLPVEGFTLDLSL
ncbi:hypothetical protein NLI96_g6629 [Meripilus lineatus]|uniref:Uncharacterized protein n=1 Tax=Meripilus lineatus TaxID=2056292 RepID=A0AAD5V175_9APHY|nr:hypothetical protein NLI96_g6629 [Physisporinus lineatus]